VIVCSTEAAAVFPWWQWTSGDRPERERGRVKRTI